MDELVRYSDPAHAQRRLRDWLTEVHTGEGPTSTVPHGFDTDPLLDHALTRLDRGGARDHADYFETLARTAVAVTRCRSRDEGRVLFERGVAEADDPAVAASFHYLSAHHDLYPRNELIDARNALDLGLGRAGTQWRLRARMLLLRGEVDRCLQDYASADAAYDQVLDSGPRAFRAVALCQLSTLRAHQRRLDDALELAHAAIDAAGTNAHYTTRSNARNLASVHLAREEDLEAASILEELRTEERRILDLQLSGMTCNNLSVARARLGDLDGALQSTVEALHIYLAAGKRLLAGTAFSNLGTILGRTDRIEAGFAAFDRAVDTARRFTSPGAELVALVSALRMILENGIASGRVRMIMKRSREILTSSRHLVERGVIEELAAVTADLYLAGGEEPADGSRVAGAEPALATPRGQEELDALIGPLDPDRYARALERRLGDGLVGIGAPSVPELRDFLLLFTGDRLRAGDYAREFGLTPGRVQHHLKALCRRDVIELSGVRRWATYVLAFHRTPAAREQVAT